MVYGELGRVPLDISVKVRLVNLFPQGIINYLAYCIEYFCTLISVENFIHSGLIVYVSHYKTVV